MGTVAMAEAGEVDIYRDTPLRHLGYANEVGEAFRALMHVRWVRATYGVASAYVLADTYDKGVKQSQEPGADTSKVAIAAMDTLLWQALVSQKFCLEWLRLRGTGWSLVLVWELSH